MLSDGRGGSGPLVLCRAQAPRAPLFLHLFEYFERLILSLGAGSLKFQTAFSFTCISLMSSAGEDLSLRPFDAKSLDLCGGTPLPGGLI